MPVLEKIVISDFRNIGFQELFFSPNINCISGNNGEGKTNLLDAVYYLSMTKSAFASSDRYNFRYGTGEFSIGGTYRMHNGLESRFSVSVRASGEKKIRRDDKPYRKISEHIGVLPVVMVSPSDISLVSESGEERRRFVNSVLSQMDREYLYSLQQYNRLLAQRNSMLKGHTVNPELMEVLDARMEKIAQPLFEARRKFADDIGPAVAQYYNVLSAGRETVGIEYRSDLQSGSLTYDEMMFPESTYYTYDITDFINDQFGKIGVNKNYLQMTDPDYGYTLDELITADRYTSGYRIKLVIKLALYDE